MPTILLLIASNAFMTSAWYWHLKVRSDAMPLIGFIALSWFIALPEYCLAVPANRMGAASLGGTYTSWQLKVLQEGIALTLFLVFALAYLRELPRWQDLLGLVLILAVLMVSLWSRSPLVQA